MVKAIFSSPIGRKIATTAMLTTAVIGANASNLKTNNENVSINQTEVVSPEAAMALKTRIVTVSNDKYEHNKKMDKLLLATCQKPSETKNVKTSADAVYRIFGTYGAMIELQRSLDDYYMEKTFDAYLQHYGMSENDRKAASEIISHFNGWKDNVYYAELFKDELEMYEKEGVPTFEACIEMVDNHINNKEFFEEEDKVLYNEFSNKFMSKQSQLDTVQAKADLLAYKVHMLNAIAFNNYFANNDSIPNSHLLLTAFGYDFVNGDGVVKP